MKFVSTPIAGGMVIEPEAIADHRGHFARVWCQQDLAREGLEAAWSQANVQFSPAPGTLRGMHLQTPPHEEVKLVRCTRGRVYDVMIDLRPSSASYLKWFGIELDPDSMRTVWVPESCAHGFVTLEPDSEVLYMTSKPFAPDSATGVRFDDPAFAIDWPVPIQVASERDRTWPLMDV